MPKPPLEYWYSEREDVLTVEGMRYSGYLFRAWSEHGIAIGKLLRIVRRDDGVVTLMEVDEGELLQRAIEEAPHGA